MNTLIDQQLEDYYIYLALRDAEFSNEYIAKQLGYCLNDLLHLVSLYEFQSSLEYDAPVTSGKSKFEAFPQLAKNIENLLTSKEIEEIHQFIRKTAIQHDGICAIQEFYHREQDFSFFLIDNSEICKMSKCPFLNHNKPVIIMLNENCNA